MKSTERTPRIASWRAWVITSRTCLTPESSADKPTKFCPIVAAIREAIVVLPVPGGPYKMTEASPEPSTNRRNGLDRKSTRLNSSHVAISYAVFCLKKKKKYLKK